MSAGPSSKSENVQGSSEQGSRSSTPSSSSSEVIYKVVSSDGELFKVSQGAIGQTVTLNTMIESLGLEDVENMEPIPVANVDGATLKFIFKWCEHYKGWPIPEETGNIPRKAETPEFDEELMNEMSHEELFHTIVAANFLNIKRLMNVTCAKVASFAKGKSPEELRVVFEIPTDEEDEAAAEQAEREKQAAAGQATASGKAKA